MSNIFISYRRDDSFAYAHTIYGKLVQHFSKDQLFMDVDTVEPGEDFVRVIEEAVGECDVLLALIGNKWMGEGGGKSRLDDPNDLVRLEISTALGRDIRIIPVLVDGMKMPAEMILPAPLKALTRRNAMEISHTRFNYDLEQLITVVRKILDETEAKRKTDEEEGRNRAHREVERKHIEVEAQRKLEEDRLLDENRQRAEEEARKKGEEKNRRRIEEKRIRAQQEAERRRLEAEGQRRAEEERLREQERQRAEQEAKQKAEEENRRRIEEEKNRVQREAEQRRIKAAAQLKLDEEASRKTDEKNQTPWFTEREWHKIGSVLVTLLVILFNLYCWWSKPKETVKIEKPIERFDLYRKTPRVP
jgi:hypothetical protein